MGYKGTKIFTSTEENGLGSIVGTEIEVTHSSLCDMTYINDIPISDSTLQEIFEHCVDYGIVDLSFTDEEVYT